MRTVVTCDLAVLDGYPPQVRGVAHLPRAAQILGVSLVATTVRLRVLVHPGLPAQRPHAFLAVHGGQPVPDDAVFVGTVTRPRGVGGVGFTYDVFRVPT